MTRLLLLNLGGNINTNPARLQELRKGPGGTRYGLPIVNFKKKKNVKTSAKKIYSLHFLSVWVNLGIVTKLF